MKHLLLVSVFIMAAMLACAETKEIHPRCKDVVIEGAVSVPLEDELPNSNADKSSPEKTIRIYYDSLLKQDKKQVEDCFLSVDNFHMVQQPKDFSYKLLCKFKYLNQEDVVEISVSEKWDKASNEIEMSFMLKHLNNSWLIQNHSLVETNDLNFKEEWDEADQLPPAD